MISGTAPEKGITLLRCTKDVQDSLQFDTELILYIAKKPRADILVLFVVRTQGLMNIYGARKIRRIPEQLV